MTSNRFRFRAWDKSFQKYRENVIVSTINEEITVYERLVNGNTLLIPSAHVVLEQCTGLKDKNGRLIYEGDIIKITEGVLPVDSKYVDCLFKAIWADIGFYLETLNGKDGLDFCECWEYEIVGNLHENPELLVVKETIKETIYKEPEVRDGWFVYEAGQNPLCYYWYCTLCSFDLKDKDGYACTVSVEGCTTFNQAVEQANKLAEELENVSKN